MRISPSISISVSPTPISFTNFIADSFGTFLSSDQCHGFWFTFFLIVPSSLFVVYLAFNAKDNLKKLSSGRWNVMIGFYSLLWFATLINFLWSCLQVWQCTPGKEVAWILLSLLTTSAMLCLEISLLGFLVQENYTTGFNSLSRTFAVAGLVVSIDAFLKAICVFGFGIPMFYDGRETTRSAKWGLWIIQRLLVTGVYGFILFIHYSKWREKLPPRPAFYRYVTVMFALNAVAVFACGLAGLGINFGIWLYNLTNLCYHSFYLPFLYVTFLSDFFQEEDFLLDTSYYSEMRDAGFFDADWD